MKCPTCQGELVRSEKNPDYLLCYHCQKKFNHRDHSQDKGRLPRKREAESDCKDGERLRYANVPPEEIRKKSEAAVRQGYRDMVSIGEEDRPSYIPAFILAIVIIALAGAGIYLWVL